MRHKGQSVPRLRAEAGQLRWAMRQYASRSRLRRQWEVIRNLDVPALPKQPRGQGAIWAVSVVRDERDVLGAVLDHLLSQGIDHVLIADNGSWDGTRELLMARAQDDHRIHVVIDRHRAHHQSEKMTYLAHLAWRHGADWIVPFDADEFHFARGKRLADCLHETDADVIFAAFHHMVPTTATALVDRDTTFVLDSHADFPGKVVARSHPLMEIIPGNHDVTRIGRRIRGLYIGHALYRSPEQVARKFRQGMESSAAVGTVPGEHWIRGNALTDEDIASAWANLSQGRPEPRLRFAAVGPMITVQPLTWPTWDPDEQLPVD